MHTPVQVLARRRGAADRPHGVRASKGGPGGRRRPMVKKKVGKYEIGRTLGEGTFGKVKYAVNSETSEHVAIKVLDKERVRRLGMGEQIKKEIAVMKMVKQQRRGVSDARSATSSTCSRCSPAAPRSSSCSSSSRAASSSTRS